MLLCLFLYPFILWAALLLAPCWGGSLLDMIPRLQAALQSPLKISWTEQSAPSIFVCTGLYVLGLAVYFSSRGRTRDGEEHGSAAWGSARELNRQFAQKQSKILTRHVRLGLDSRRHRRSLNVLVIGGSGAAKTRSYVLPNILEANANYVITDPKSEVLLATGGYLKSKGYEIRVLNLVNLSESDGYNPFCYLRDEKDALKLVNNLIQATTPKGSHENDPFWTKAETALLQAIILMLMEEAPPEEQNFSMVVRTLEYAEVSEDDDSAASPLDILYESLERRHPESVAVRQYKVFKQAAGKTAKSILVSAAVRLAAFNLPQVKAITDHDDMNLYSLGERKVALYSESQPWKAHMDLHRRDLPAVPARVQRKLPVHALEAGAEIWCLLYGHYTECGRPAPKPHSENHVGEFRISGDAESGPHGSGGAGTAVEYFG